MDIKRLLLALVLSFVFIITWNVFFPPPAVSDSGYESQQVDDEVVNNKNVKLNQELDNKNIKSFSKEISANIVTPLLNLNLVNGGTSIADCKIVETKNGSLKHVGAWGNNGEIYYDDIPVELMKSARCNPCIKVDGEYIYFNDFSLSEISGEGAHSVVSISESGITKETIIAKDSYVVEHRFENFPEGSDVSVVWDAGILPSEKMLNDDISYFSVFAQNQDSYSEEFLSGVDVGSSLVFDDEVGWAGIKSKYFMNAITNQNFNELKADKVVFKAVEENINGLIFTNAEVEFFYNFDDLSYSQSGQKGLAFSSYMGPIDTGRLEGSKTQHLVQLFGFGWFFIGYLGKGIMWLLTSLYKVVPNYGIICIMFAFLIRLLTGPLTKKSFLSNQKMQAIQPKMKKIQDKYKDNPTQLNQEIMSLYKNEGVNPLGGCLPILVQMPLLIALFQVFRKTIEFRGAPFLPFWITDLSQPDVVLNVPFLGEVWGLSYFFGHGIALLPILMGVVMFMNMKMTATSNMNPQATSTMYIMNGFFVLLFNTFPSGLNLYYTVYNILNFIQQRKLQKL